MIYILLFILPISIFIAIYQARSKTNYRQWLKNRNNLDKQIIELDNRKNSKIQELKELDQQIQNYYTSNIEIANQHYELAIQVLNDNYNQKVADLQKQFNELEYKEQFTYSKKINEYQEKLQQTQEDFKELQNKINSCIEVAKRAEANRTQKNFYRIQLSETDIEEIKKLRSIEPYLRNKEPLNKVIWKCYYEKPTNDLIGRVVGKTTRTGIYKITNLQNNMCYVGQCLSFADRWKQHIKRGIGAETPTQNKLYPAMLAIGPENFMFEIIEDCPKEQLNQKEQEYQQIFGAKEFGYSIK